MILLLLMVASVLGVLPPRVAGGVCNQKDQSIYDALGQTFPHKFRKLGGFFVSKEQYEAAIVENYKLSPACAGCYGTAYVCGWNHCKVDCALEGVKCKECLEAERCISDWNTCSGLKIK